MLTEFKLSWRTITGICKSLAKNISVSYQPEVIVGIAKGGLIPAVLLTHILKCTNLVSVQFISYDHRERLHPQLLNPLCCDTVCGKVLLVDDIVDSGYTMNLAKSYLFSCGAKMIKTAALLYKSRSVHKPDFYGMKKSNRTWVVFPWEVNT